MNSGTPVGAFVVVQGAVEGATQCVDSPEIENCKTNTREIWLKSIAKNPKSAALTTDSRQVTGSVITGAVMSL